MKSWPNGGENISANDISKFIEHVSNSFSEEEIKEIEKILEQAIRGEFPRSSDIIKALEVRIKEITKEIEDRILPELRRRAIEI